MRRRPGIVATFAVGGAGGGCEGGARDASGGIVVVVLFWLLFAFSCFAAVCDGAIVC